MNQTSSSENAVLNDIEITGSITFKGTLDFGGKLHKGSITGEHLLVGKTAEINGNILADSLRMEGTITGNITVKGKCDLGESAVLTGDIKASSIAMAEGATIIGQMQIGSVAAQSKPKQ
jgi:cytoskeletal protein CcmA (bactofilin family)